MTCSETREYLFAFLDSELDAPLSIELQRHVERCHDCAREIEIERAVKRQLSTRLETQSAEYVLDEAALMRAMMSERPSRSWVIQRLWWASSPLRHSRRAGLLAAAAIMIVATSLWVIGPRSHADRSGERFTVLVVRDFEHFLEEGQELQITSADPGVVTDWLRARTKLDMALPLSKAPAFQLVGGRKCKIDGQAAAFAVFEIDGQPASLVCVADDDWNLAGMTREALVHKPGEGVVADVEDAGPTYWLDSDKGYTVVAWKQDGMIYAAVSMLSREKLLSLTTGALHEGD
jgi:anti-sigma factor RsiW